MIQDCQIIVQEKLPEARAELVLPDVPNVLCIACVGSALISKNSLVARREMSENFSSAR